MENRIEVGLGYGVCEESRFSEQKRGILLRCKDSFEVNILAGEIPLSTDPEGGRSNCKDVSGVFDRSPDADSGTAGSAPGASTFI